ncbi:unannotated protein [freshwater metagenome]|uniref:Unannotated protein n=1 Tax=freshwater metagenome TaxID=449393 RepID=A0A6J7LNA0_9ZZZZ
MAVPGNREKFRSGKQFPSDIPHHKPEKTHESAAGVPLDPKPRTALRPSGTCFLVVGFDDGRAVSGPLHRSAAILRRGERLVRLAHGHDLGTELAVIRESVLRSLLPPEYAVMLGELTKAWVSMTDHIVRDSA